MTAYRDYSNDLLEALYRLHKEHGPERYISFADIHSEAGLKIDDFYLPRFTDEWQDHYVELSKHMGPHSGWSAKMKASGYNYVEDELLSLDSDDEISVSSVTFKDEFSAEVIPAASAVEGARWTGLPTRFEMTEVVRVHIVSELERIEDALSSVSLGQQERAQVRALVVAAKVLSEAPEPPSDLVWNLIQRASDVSGIASLFVALIALFS